MAFTQSAVKSAWNKCLRPGEDIVAECVAANLGDLGYDSILGRPPVTTWFALTPFRLMQGNSGAGRPMSTQFAEMAAVTVSGGLFGKRKITYTDNPYDRAYKMPKAFALAFADRAVPGAARLPEESCQAIAFAFVPDPSNVAEVLLAQMQGPGIEKFSCSECGEGLGFASPSHPEGVYDRCSGCCRAVQAQDSGTSGSV